MKGIEGIDIDWYHIIDNDTFYLYIIFFINNIYQYISYCISYILETTLE